MFLNCTTKKTKKMIIDDDRRHSKKARLLHIQISTWTSPNEELKQAHGHWVSNDGHRPYDHSGITHASRVAHAMDFHV